MSLSALAADKTQYLVNVSFSFTLQLINSISSDLQKLLIYFNGAAIFAFSKMLFDPSDSVFPNNVALYSNI